MSLPRVDRIANGRCLICGNMVDTAGDCGFDHRPARLYPGYDNSGGPLTQDQRCEVAAEKIYKILRDGTHHHDREECVLRLTAALRGLFP